MECWRNSCSAVSVVHASNLFSHVSVIIGCRILIYGSRR